MAHRRSLFSLGGLEQMFPGATALAVGVASLATVDADAAKAKRYANCTALHRDYPHGVGRSGARDHVRGSTRPVTNFRRNTRVYNPNKFSDRDHDGVACEQR